MTELDRASRAELTPRELEVLGHVADGRTNTEIGRLIFLSPETIKSHLRNIYMKLSARNRWHAVSIAFRAGILE